MPVCSVAPVVVRDAHRTPEGVVVEGLVVAVVIGRARDLARAVAICVACLPRGSTTRVVRPL